MSACFTESQNEFVCFD